MGHAASREETTKKLLEQSALTLPLGSQVEKLFHEDFDDDAQAILTPNTPTTPALLLNDKKQKRRSWRNSLDLNKWAPVQPGVSSKRDSAHGSSNGTSTEYLSPQAGLSTSSSRPSSEVSVARPVISLQAKGRDDGTQDDNPATADDLATQNISPQPVYGQGWSTANAATNQILPSPIASQSSLRLPEHITPQLAVSRIAARMAANALTSNNSGASTPPQQATTTPSTSKHDSALLAEDIATQDFQPANLLPDPDHPAESHLLQRIAAEGGAQKVLKQAREQSRGRQRQRARSAERSYEDPNDKLRRSAPTSAARLEDVTEVASPKSSIDLPQARWQQRVAKRLSDQEVSDEEKKRLSELSLTQRMTWLEGPSAPNSDRESD